jgi:hypothetical protein
LQCRKASYQSANQMVEIGIQMQYAAYNKEPLPIDENRFLIKLSDEDDEDAKDAKDNELANDCESTNDGEPSSSGSINNDEPINDGESISDDEPTNNINDESNENSTEGKNTLEILFSNIHRILDPEDVQKYDSKI